MAEITPRAAISNFLSDEACAQGEGTPRTGRGHRAREGEIAKHMYCLVDVQFRNQLFVY